jgi:hypothetical protein
MSFTISRLAATYGKSPFICIEYYDENGKPQYRKFTVVFSYFTNREAFYQTLITDYPDYFNENTIAPEKLKKFVDYIISNSPKLDLTNANKEEIDMFKEQMNREFEMNVIKPGDPDFQYDLKVDFDYDGEKNTDWD